MELYLVALPPRATHAAAGLVILKWSLSPLPSFLPSLHTWSASFLPSFLSSVHRFPANGLPSSLPSFLPSLSHDAESRGAQWTLPLPDRDHAAVINRSPATELFSGRSTLQNNKSLYRAEKKYLQISLSWVGIQWRADDNYTRKFCSAVADLLLNFDNFW